MKRLIIIIILLSSSMFLVIDISRTKFKNIDNEIIQSSIKPKLSSSSPTYINKNPIKVTNNLELADIATSGSGTKNDPYLLKDYNIQTTGNHGIQINGTTKFFEIINCNISTNWDYQKYLLPIYSQDGYMGILISNVADGTAKIIDNILTRNLVAIGTFDTNNITIANNTCKESQVSIQILSSDSSVITNNFLINSSSCHLFGLNLQNSLISRTRINISESEGILFHSSSSNLITFNLIIACKFYGVLILEDCISNVIYQNVFIKNSYGLPSGTPQAADHGINNLWYDPISNQGNSWSDYLGSGVYQIDGLANNEDPYPSRVTLTTTTTTTSQLPFNLKLDEILILGIGFSGIVIMLSTVKIIQMKRKPRSSIELSQTEEKLKIDISKKDFINFLSLLIKEGIISIYNIKVVNISEDSLIGLNIDIKSPKTSKIITFQNESSKNDTILIPELKSNKLYSNTFSIISLNLPLMKDLSKILVNYTYLGQNYEYQLQDYNYFKNNQLILRTRSLRPFKKAFLFLDLYNRVLKDLPKLLNDRIKLAIKNKILKRTDEYLKNEIIQNWQYHLLIVNKKDPSPIEDRITISMLKSGMIFAIKTEAKIDRKFTTMRETIEIKLDDQNQLEFIVAFTTVQLPSLIPVLGIFYKNSELHTGEEFIHDDIEIIWVTKKGESLKKDLFDLMNHTTLQ